MKKVLLIALCFAIPMAGFAQKKKKKGAEPEVVAPVVETLTDEECMENISLFQQNVKMKLYDDAYGPWLAVYQSRPDFASQIYTNGAKILAYRYEQATDSALRIAIRDSIMQLHDDRIKYFDDVRYPDAYVLGLKGVDYLTYFVEDELAMPAYGWLKDAVTNLGANAQINMIRKFVEISYKIYKSNPDHSSQFLNDYQTASSAMAQIAAAGGKNATEANNQKSYLDRLYAASGAADCSQMDQMYASVVAESATDLEKLTSVMKLYRRLDCTESEVYFAAVESAHKLQPSSESAAGCAQMCLKKDDINGAIEYYKQALSLVDNNEDKADYLYRLANVYLQSKNYQQCVSYAQQALDIDPENGRCYLLIGLSYANGNRVSDDDVLNLAKFWVACDMFNKAAALDETCKEAAKNFSNTYSQYFPSKEDIFFHRDLNENAPYRVGGWINRTTTCRAKK